VLEALEGKLMVALDHMLRQRTAELAVELLQPCMDELQRQVDGLVATVEARVAALAAGADALAAKADAALLAAQAELSRGGGRLEGLETRVGALADALAANSEADRQLQAALQRVGQTGGLAR
jgi:hypothetical protein